MENKKKRVKIYALNAKDYDELEQIIMEHNKDGFLTLVRPIHYIDGGIFDVEMFEANLEYFAKRYFLLYNESEDAYYYGV